MNTRHIKSLIHEFRSLNNFHIGHSNSNIILEQERKSGSLTKLKTKIECQKKFRKRKSQCIEPKQISLFTQIQRPINFVPEIKPIDNDMSVSPLFLHTENNHQNNDEIISPIKHHFPKKTVRKSSVKLDFEKESVSRIQARYDISVPDKKKQNYQKRNSIIFNKEPKSSLFKVYEEEHHSKRKNRYKKYFNQMRHLYLNDMKSIHHPSNKENQMTIFNVLNTINEIKRKKFKKIME